MRQILIPLVILALAVSGCSLAPDYEPPAPPSPQAWAAPAADGLDAPADCEAPDIGWQEFVADRHLQEIITLALANNRDLRTAALSVEKVRAAYRIQRSDLYPNLSVIGNGERYRVPEEMSMTGRAETTEQYSVNLGVAAWELDFFGRIRSLKDAALDQYLATRQARAAAEISLVAAVANSYLALAADRENLELARATLETHQASYELIRQSRELGVATDLDLRQAQSQVDAARADVARFTGLTAVDRNALVELVGAPIRDDVLPIELSRVTEMSDIAAGLPSDVLLRRPDILMTEHRLRAATANIGAARAAFFPRISLTAGAGSLSNELSGLLGSGTRTWSFTPQVILPLFSGGRLRANLEAVRIEREIAVAGYEKAIQTAFREASDALTLRTTLAEQEAAQRSLVEALGEAHRLSKARYEEGMDGYLGVLVAERSLYAARQGLDGVRLAGQVNLVTLFKVLGGGAAAEHDEASQER